MISYNIHEKHIKRDSWVKEINKTYNPEILADLIKKRIEYPSSTGPFIRYNSDELPSDIIVSFISDSEESRKKLVPAIGLLLYRMMHGKMPGHHDVLRGLFSVIRGNKLTECRTLVANWLHNKYAQGSSDGQWKQTYRDAMMAYAQIQDKNTATEEWWYNIWKECGSWWWPAAFLGLRIQNPTAACNELQLLISRNIDKTGYLLVGMWKIMLSLKVLIGKEGKSIQVSKLECSV